jgi:arylsulfatase A-like enzyme
MDITHTNQLFRKRVQAVQAIDEMIGALEQTLAASGHANDTYVFFTSDNGYHIGERSQPQGKQTAFDTDIRVPLIVTGPGVPEGVTVDQIAQNIDLCSTFSELGHIAPPATVDGHSLVPLLQGEPVVDWLNVALIEHHDAAFDPDDPDAESDAGVTKPPTYSALRTAQSVYVEYVSGETEFHDHATDPFEITNTAGALSPAQVQTFHAAIGAVKTCKTNAQCWSAQLVRF